MATNSDPKQSTPQKADPALQQEGQEEENPEIDAMLENNRQFVDETNQRHPMFFKELSKEHKPKYLMIGCSDARIQPNSLLKLNPGELFIHRNIANQVFQGDLNVNAVIQYAVEALGIRDVIIMGHSKCGGVMASMKPIPYEVVDQWIVTIREIYDTQQNYFKDILNEDTRASALAKLNVRYQCMNLRKNASIRRMKDKGQKIRIHGWFLDTSTGLIETLKFNNEYMKKLFEVHSDTLLRLSSYNGTLFVENQPKESVNNVQAQRKISEDVTINRPNPSDPTQDLTIHITQEKAGKEVDPKEQSLKKAVVTQSSGAKDDKANKGESANMRD